MTKDKIERKVKGQKTRENFTISKIRTKPRFPFPDITFNIIDLDNHRKLHKIHLLGDFV